MKLNDIACVVILVSGIYSIAMAIVMETRNFRSQMLLKFIPAIFAILQLFSVLYLMGWIIKVN